MENKKYKTAAALRRILEDRLAAEKLNLAAEHGHLLLIEARIELVMELLATADASGNEEEVEG